jgi:hypothetical protein
MKNKILGKIQDSNGNNVLTKGNDGNYALDTSHKDKDVWKKSMTLKSLQTDIKGSLGNSDSKGGRGELL